MKSVAIASCLAALANAAAVNVREKSPLSVNIEQIGNSEVKATITNTGDVALRVVRTGSILDAAPVEKVKITQASMRALHRPN